MTADDFAALLEAHGYTVRGRRAQCPGHDGRDLNLAFADGDTGLVVDCKSHACDVGVIVAPLGIGVADLFEDANARRNGKPDPAPTKNLPSEDALAAAVDRLGKDPALLDRLRGWRGWTPDVLRRMGVGCGIEPGRLTIPTRAPDDALIGTLQLRPEPEP
jgi:prepilin-type processing-associated H-X9-DG protein